MNEGETTMSFRYGMVLLWVSLLLPSVSGDVFSAEVTVILAEDAEPLEQTAAQELDDQFERLFGSNVSISTELPDQGHVVLLGSPSTNPHVRQLEDFRWPEVSTQGVVIRTHEMNGLPGVVIGGGSPVATLWAVYEFGYQLGARYLLRGDIFPEPQPLKLGGWDVVQEPELPQRTWRTVNDFALGPESWPVADQTRLFKQLAKLRFNKIMLSVYPWQPFVHYRFRSVEKRTAMLWYGEVFEIDSDSPGPHSVSW